MRPDNWEDRLADQLRVAMVREFSTKSWNCAQFAHSCASAVSGRVLPFAWRGSLEASADAALPRVEPRLARRGDVVLAHVPEPSLGVCLGRLAAFVGRSGLERIPMSRVVAAWRV